MIMEEFGIHGYIDWRKIPDSELIFTAFCELHLEQSNLAPHVENN